MALLRGELLAEPGDVLCVRGSGFFGKVIRFGAALRGLPNLDAHVAVMHHTDKYGVPWAIEGRPGGVGWRDAREYLRDPYLVTNREQPKTAAQRAAVCKTMEATLGTAYDWEAIAEDAESDIAGGFGLSDIWKPDPVTGRVPGHVVCSSDAAYAYDKNGLAAPEPGDFRHVQPAGWTLFCLTRGWEKAA